ncbi:protein involved in DNA integration [Arthrobacter sp. Hiyo1]|uniref:hypothetical protein n=1 Tax=Arthrobacter sp. Hiyo1 TaxID=1588020 RepID=UPI0006A3A0FD|nr:hypothetical protein [Arthrobacter sp. Hiyo1]GAP61240.1 protein involved in DNA integration [Arthrobacter sp. Hiyo1]
MAPAAVSTVRSVVEALRTLAAWVHEEGLNEHPSTWTERDLDRFIASCHGSNPAKYYKAIRCLYKYRAVLSYGGLDTEPWPGASVEALSGNRSSSRKVKTPALPPAVWWPLLRACWRYIDVFAPDILKARSRWEELNKPGTASGPGRSYKDLLKDWLQDPANTIPLHSSRHHADKSRPSADGFHVHWGVLSLSISGGQTRLMFNGSKESNLPLKNLVLAPENRYRGRTFDLLPDARDVDAAGGSRSPWITNVDSRRMWHEAVALRTACYLFVAALSMLRDSELQGILRDPVVQHFGAPAIRTRKFKHDESNSEQKWWIIEPVAQALAVAQELSIHPTRVFSAVRQIDPDNTALWPNKDIRKFVRHINAHHTEMGLEEIPEYRINPHMFRRTMSIIAGQQPDGEIALGLTLKHAAVRALSNATTSGYAEPTPEWAEELKIELADATAVRLARLMHARTSGNTIAVGPGAKSFTAKLDKVASALSATDGMEGNIVDERMIRNLLRSEFSTVKFGNLNACMGDLGSALCLTGQASGTPEALTVNPARCQPHLCRNSVITSEHRPHWVATEHDLRKALKDKRISDRNRASLEQELGDIRQVISGVDRTGDE